MPGHQRPCTVASCDGEALRQRTPAPASALRHACTHARTHARARTTDDERRDVRSAGVAGWVTAGGGGYGAYTHRCGGALSLRPLSQRPCKAAAPKGSAFCFLNYFVRRRADRRAGRRGSASGKSCGENRTTARLALLRQSVRYIHTPLLENHISRCGSGTENASRG